MPRLNEIISDAIEDAIQLEEDFTKMLESLLADDDEADELDLWDDGDDDEEEIQS